MDCFERITGDVFDPYIRAEALAFSASAEAVPMAGLERQVYDRAGSGLLEERRRKGELDYGGVIVTGGYGLPFKWLLHVCTPFELSDSYNETALLGECYKACLRKADSLGVKSVAFPLLGSGMLGFDPAEAYCIAKQAITEGAKGLRRMKIMLILDPGIAELIALSEKDPKAYLGGIRREYLHRGLPEEEVADLLLEQNLHLKRARAKVAAVMEGERISREIRAEKQAYLAANAGKGTEQELEKRFVLEKLSRYIKKWLMGDKPPEEYTGRPYEPEDRTQKQLAEDLMISESSISKLMNRSCNIPSRTRLMLLAIGLRLPRAERIRFILYGNEDMRYPHDENERRLEEFLSQFDEPPLYRRIRSDMCVLGLELGNGMTSDKLAVVSEQEQDQ